MSLGRLGHYDLLERIGEGGMGVVFRARDVRLDKIVAVKVLSERHAPDPDCRARLLREARAEARLNHPNIAMCFDVGECSPEPADLLAPGLPGPHPPTLLYLAMELVPGCDLDEIIAGRPLALPRVLDLALQIAAGLEAAHAQGVVHRDLKPGNVRVTPEGRAKILDFGLAHQCARKDSDSFSSSQSTESTGRGAVVGTVLYMAPEQASGQMVDSRADLFSFGIVLYELVTGRRPFGGDDAMAALYALANEQPAPLARYAAGIPEELERITFKLLEKRPDDRYQSAHEVLTDLRRLQRGSPGRRPRVSPRAWLASGAIATAVGVALWLGVEAGRGVAMGTPSLAVLGFENATGDSEQAFLCAGLAADLEGDLVQEGHLDVASATDVMKLHGGQRAPRDAARRLGVRAVLTGALRRAGDTNRLQVELVDGRTGLVHWSGGYDLDARRAFAVKRQIATAVASSLAASRAAPRSPRAAQVAPPPGAYEEYLRGIDAIGDLDDPGAPMRAFVALDRAVALAPDLAAAWAARSRALAWRFEREHDPALMAQAERSAGVALALDPSLVPARIARARVYALTSRAPQAIADLDAVLRVNPSWDEGWRALADAYRRANDFVRADSCMRTAVAIRPRYAPNWHSLGNLQVRRGRFADARASYQRCADLAPDQNKGLEGVAQTYLREGRYREAAAAYAKLPEQVTNASMASNMGTAFYFADRLDDALRSYLLAVTLDPRDATNRCNLGDCYQRLGRGAEARAQYRQAAQLDEADLAVAPDDAEARAHHLLHLAKAGDCDRVWTEYQQHRSTAVSLDAEVQHALAKALAVCGRRREALEAIGRMAALGAATDLLRSEDEFASLEDEPAFRALLTASARRGTTKPTDPRR